MSYDVNVYSVISLWHLKTILKMTLNIKIWVATNYKYRLLINIK